MIPIGFETILKVDGLILHLCNCLTKKEHIFSYLFIRHNTNIIWYIKLFFSLFGSTSRVKILTLWGTLNIYTSKKIHIYIFFGLILTSTIERKKKGFIIDLAFPVNW